MQKTRSRAQVMIEYLMIAIIVLLAVMYGGPFLVNSIGARFVGMDGSAQDAFDEDLSQAEKPVCSCVPQSRDFYTWPHASPDVCRAQNCGALEKAYVRTCTKINGVACDQTVVCLAHVTCCYGSVAVACGTVALSNIVPNPYCVTREELPTDTNMTFPNNALGRCIDAIGAVRGCLEGERGRRMSCGRNVMHFACVPDNACPITPPDPFGGS